MRRITTWVRCSISSGCQGWTATTRPPRAKWHAGFASPGSRWKIAGGQYRFPADLEWNLKLIARQFSLTATERKILALAVMLRANDTCSDVAQATARRINLAAQVASVIGSTPAAVSKALAPGSTLRRSGLVNVSAGCNLDINVSLRRASLRRLACSRLKSIEDLFDEFLRPGGRPSLTLDDYPHVSPRVGDLLEVVREALDSRRRGVNILLHGPTRDGKNRADTDTRRCNILSGF